MPLIDNREAPEIYVGEDLLILYECLKIHLKIKLLCELLANIKKII